MKKGRAVSERSGKVRSPHCTLLPPSSHRAIPCATGCPSSESEQQFKLYHVEYLVTETRKVINTILFLWGRGGRGGGEKRRRKRKGKRERRDKES